jgi:hypothetical protein
VAYWLADIDMEGRISRTTRNLYERNVRTLVSPAFDSLTPLEIGVEAQQTQSASLAAIVTSKPNSRSLLAVASMFSSFELSMTTSRFVLAREHPT